MLEEALAEGGPWILGDQLTLADINLMPYAARLDYLGSWSRHRQLSRPVG
jgi:glutathione S-transferase